MIAADQLEMAVAAVVVVAVVVVVAAVEMVATIAAGQARITAGQKVGACMDRITATSITLENLETMIAISFVGRIMEIPMADKSRVTNLAEGTNKTTPLLCVNSLYLSLTKRLFQYLTLTFD